MPFQVVSGAMLKCSFGVAPSVLNVTPTGVEASEMPAASIINFTPIMNIAPFGMCTTESNPEVASATAAALGVLTPMPCLPVIVDPWAPGSETTTINEMPALTNTCTCSCTWGGEITIAEAGQEIVEVT